MSEYIHALRAQEFLQVALLTGLLASVACGVVGSYVVVRRITYLAGGIAHCVLGGLGAAQYVAVAWGWSWVHPLHGATVAALLAGFFAAPASVEGRAGCPVMLMTMMVSPLARAANRSSSSSETPFSLA